MCVSGLGAHGSVTLAATVVANVCDVTGARGKCSWCSKRALRTPHAMSIPPALLLVRLTESKLQRNMDPRPCTADPAPFIVFAQFPSAAPSNCLVGMSVLVDEE